MCNGGIQMYKTCEEDRSESKMNQTLISVDKDHQKHMMSKYEDDQKYRSVCDCNMLAQHQKHESGEIDVVGINSIYFTITNYKYGDMIEYMFAQTRGNINKYWTRN